MMLPMNLWIALVWSASMISSSSSAGPRSHFRIVRVEGEAPIPVERRSFASSEDHLVTGLKGLQLSTPSYGQVQPKLNKLIIRHSRRSSPSIEESADMESPPNSDPSRNDSSEPSPRTPRTPRPGEEMELIGASNGHSRISLLIKDRSNCHLLLEGSGVVLISRDLGGGIRTTSYLNLRIPSGRLDSVSDETILSILHTRQTLKLILEADSIIQIYLPTSPFEQQSADQRRSFIQMMAMARDQATLPAQLLEEYPGYLVEAILVIPPGSASGSVQSSPVLARRIKHRAGSFARSRSKSEESDTIVSANSSPSVLTRAESDSNSAMNSPQISPILPRVQFKRNPKFKPQATPRSDSSNSLNNDE